MKIAITGGGGLVGKELARIFSAQHQVLALTHRTLDITDSLAVKRLMTAERPELIINCAVLGVDDCEAKPDLARAVNVEGARSLAEAAAEIDAEIMHLSTNYIFEGTREAGTFYTIEDAALPINKYGETKLAGELAVRIATPKSYLVRTSWVFGPGKENFFSTAARSLAERKSVRAVNDVWASVTYLADLVAGIDEILKHGHYATYQVVNAGVCSHADFAREIARQLELTPAETETLIETVAESEMRRLAPRPRYTPMRCL
ncbi:MAG TPA: NAD(P)-dependent oxidoreductase, partial [Blastocatellia bacterium]|nr:NAD(P)-dependent oxidoreductase [Blastocatellia bacterium]